MITYLDASVILRPLLRQLDGMDLSPLHPAVTSRITRVELFRTLDRWRLRGLLAERDHIRMRTEAQALLKRLTVVELESHLLDRSEEAMPLPLASLDALHLVTANHWRSTTGEPLLFATHDRALGDAARAYGFEVVGA